MTKQWLVLKEDEELGPISSGDLRQWSNSGKLKKTDFVKKQGMDSWVKATKVRGLAFGSVSDGERLTTAYLTLSKKIFDVFESGSIESSRRNEVLIKLSNLCFDESLIKQLRASDGMSDEYIRCALGHDFLYWSTLAILADGKVEKDELITIGALLQQIAQAFSKQFEKYSQFSDLSEAKYEAFLATFKKDRAHYEWKKISMVSQDVMIGSQVAMAASIFSPLSECLESYVHIVESIVSTIIMIDGETPEEKALLVRSRRIHKKILEQLSVANQPVERPSPLLQEIPSNSKNATKEEFAFRKTNWGMSRDEVLRSEATAPFHETDEGLMFNGSIVKLEAWIIYVFAAGICIRSKYSIKEQHSHQNQYLTHYHTLRNLLIQKYGLPEGVSENELENGLGKDLIWRDDLFQDDYDEWGHAVSIGHLALKADWKTSNSEISLCLVGDNYEIDLCVEYKSREFGYLEDQINQQQHLDDL